ncbi:MAG: carbohydrate ABC transporter substrate-binding protein [bacterium]|nr:carbohydrate ABC transporter substrate-binding protein [bacterium]
MKQFKWLLLVVVFAMLAAACGNDADEDTTTAAPSETTAATTEAPDSGTDTTEAPATTTTEEPMVDLAGTRVTVFGPEETEAEAGAMQAALDLLAAETGIEIIYTGARDAADQINAQVAGGNPPDVFVFPQPGKLADFARQGALLPLPADVEAVMNDNHIDAWTSFGNVDGTQFGIPTKADLKSLVWYQPAPFEAAGYTVPQTWDELKALTNQMIADGNTPWCVGIESGPATGWTFTDWVEDLMLRFHGGDVYDQWVANEVPFSDERVVQVFNEVVDLWNTDGAVFAAGGSIASTGFGDNGEPLVQGRCMLHRQASFFSSFFPEGTPAADGSDGAIDVFYFPSVKGDKPVLGAGTLVGAFADRPEVWEVMKYFATSDYADARQSAQAELKGGGGALSGFLSPAVNADLSLYQPLEQSFLEILSTAEVVRFDGSDLMPTAVGAGSFWTEGTSFVNGQLTAEEAAAAIDATWP